ncbi:helix-turn-helix domain-containing protein [Leucobacter chromiiresistens]|uniref:helix-turn-helix domain-containing protein n=1 Tax=Leucobacter chromiiresistens TaxID=1079994 RepID=UPI0009EBB340|nr:helix-turn-helix transcriptional regulator [Leucobacter chromiiresistens]
MSVFPVGDAAYDAIFAEEAAMIDASESIAEALERSGLSQVELAELLGVSKSEISARLRGERNITVRKLAATLHVLGASLKIEANFAGSEKPQQSTKWRFKPEAHAHRVSQSELASAYISRSLMAA